MAEEDKDDLFEGTTDDTTGGESGDADDAPAPQSGADSDESSDSKADDKDKRIRDLMSRAQKAEAALAKATKSESKPEKDASTKADETAEEDEFTTYMRESVRKQLHSELELADFGIEVSAVTGNTVAEMRASAQAHKRMAETLETKLRSRVLEEHGLNPDIVAQPEKKVDFAGMSNEDFEKWYAANKQR